MSNREVAIEFVKRRQPYGTNPKRSFYFEGDRLFSYGPHFVVARWDGDRLLYSSRHRSVTTSQHQSLFRRAAHAAGSKGTTVYDAGHTPDQELAWAVKERGTAMQEVLKRVTRPKDAAKHIARLDWWDKDGVPQVCETFSLAPPVLEPWPERLVALKAECVLRGYL